MRSHRSWRRIRSICRSRSRRRGTARAAMITSIARWTANSTRYFIDELIDAKSVPLKRFEDTQWFESLSADRGDRPPRRRYSAIRPDEAERPARSEDRPRAVRLRATAAGKSDGRRLRAGRISKPSEIRRAGPRSAADPGLENAEFLQFGQIHRNTFINSPKILNETLSTRKDPASVFSPARSPVSRAMSSPSRPAGWPD